MDTDEGAAGSRAACNNTSNAVLLTFIIFDCGSGNAEENAHSSSSPAGSGTGGSAGGFGLAKSNIEGCCDVGCRGETKAANGSIIGACCFARSAACCCWNRVGCGVVDWDVGWEEPKAEENDE